VLGNRVERTTKKTRTLGESAPDFLLRQLGGVGAVGCCCCGPRPALERDGESGEFFKGDGRGGWAAGGERIAMDAWRMFARRMPKRASSGKEMWRAGTI
jgi:hypothetical protein